MEPCRHAIGPPGRLLHHLRQTGRPLPGPTQESAEHIDDIAAARAAGRRDRRQGLRGAARGRGHAGPGLFSAAPCRRMVGKVGPRFPVTRHLDACCPSVHHAFLPSPPCTVGLCIYRPSLGRGRGLHSPIFAVEETGADRAGSECTWGVMGQAWRSCH